MEPISDFLFARPSFLEGFVRIFDMGNTLSEYNYSTSSEEADKVATWMDWEMVAASIRRAAASFREQSTAAVQK